MPNKNRPIEIPESVKKLFNNTANVSLKVLASVEDSENSEMFWGVFFNIKNKTPDGSLWLLPLNEETKKFAQTASKSGIPPIVCSEIVIKNENHKKDGTWNDYYFWDDSEKDLRLKLEVDTVLNTGVSGEWGNKGGWPYFKMSGKQTSDNLLVLEAPGCHIVNSKGMYDDFKIWFGIRNKIQPFITIDEKNRGTGNDCPIVWFEDERQDDMVFIHGKKDFEITKFIEEPVLAAYKNGRSEILAKELYDSNTNHLNSWFFQGSDNILSVIYCKSFQYFNNEIVKIIQLNKSSDQINDQKLFTKFYSPGRILNQGEKLIREVSKSIEHIQSSNPVGIVPILSVFKQTEPSSLVTEWSVNRSNTCGNVFFYNINKSVFFKEDGSTVVRFDGLEIELPLLKTTDATRTITLSKVNIEAGTSQKVNDNGTVLFFKIQSFAIAKGFDMIDGPFEFEIERHKEFVNDSIGLGNIRFTLQNRRTQQPFFLWQWHENLKGEIVLKYAIEDFSIPVKNVKAAGQDLLNHERYIAPGTIGAATEGFGERSEPPLIIPIANESKNNFMLTFSESINVGQDYRLDIKLQEINPDANVDRSTRIKAVIIDSNPQFVGLLDARFLQQPGHDDGAWILARRSPLSVENGEWEILDDKANTEGFKLILPSQAIGEAYTKSNQSVPGARGEPEEGKPVEYKFGAPAILKIANERLERRYVSPPWNLRSIWGTSGDTTPGVPLLEAQFELLYGLTGLLKPQETHIAELGAKLGEIPSPPGNSIFWEPTKIQNDYFSGAWNRYLEFYRAWKSRLAILEPSKEDDFGKARFDSELTYQPRIKIENGKRVGASLLPPLKLDDAFPEEKAILDLHDQEKGLAGGFHYGFESKEIYKEFWREALKKGSSSAELIDPAFSSLGGWGKQTARFAGDKTVIKSTTAMGRTHFYAVERIGRIGVLWHKAKHVIEYERTIVPSEYFQDQPALLGRPIVRKVREYIEILELTKSYPDFSGQSDEAPGSIKSCTFKSKIIPVKSSWGKDVSFNINSEVQSFGWEIPLWHPDADEKLFPKPQVTFGLIAPLNANFEECVVNLSEPQNLFFYTDTRESVTVGAKEKEPLHLTADTTKWPAIKYIDFTDLKLPKETHLQPSIDKSSGKGMELMMPDILDVPPGFERFTFRIDPSELPSGVANRYNEKSGISGKLRTVTMMRMPAEYEKSEIPETAEIKIYKSIVENYDPVKGDNSLLNSVYNLDFTKDLKVFEDKILELGHKLETLKGVSVPNLKHYDAVYKNAVLETTPVRLLWKEIILSAEGAVNRALGSYDAYGKTFSDEINALLKQGGEIKEEALHALDRLGEKIDLTSFSVDIADEFFASVEKQTDLGILLTEKKLTETKQDAVKFIRDKIQDVKSDIDDLEIDKIKERFNIFTQEVISANNELMSKINSLNLPFKDIEKYKNAINSVSTKITAEIGAINTEIQVCTIKEDAIAVINEVDSELEELIDRLDAELQNLLTFIIDHKKYLFTTINNDLDTIRKRIKNLESELKAAIKEQINVIRNDWTKNESFIKGTVEEEIQKIRHFICGHDKNGIITGTQTITLESLIEDVIYKVPATLPDDNCIYKALLLIDQSLKKWITDFKNEIQNNLIDRIGGFTEPKEVQEWLQRIEAYKKLQDAIKNKDKDEIINQGTAFANTISKDFGQLAGEVAEKVKDAYKAQASFEQMANSGQQVLDNYRSVWEELKAPGLGLNRKTISMIVNKDYRNDIEKKLSITPCLSRIKQFEHDLEGLGLRLPVTNIFEGLLPPKPEWADYGNSLMDKFNFSDILSDIGAMRLDKLFPNFKMPNKFRDNIKIDQGFDKQTLTAWVNAEADIELDGPQSILKIGPIDVQLLEGRFVAKVRMEIDIEGKTTKENSGMLSGDWQTNIAGTPIMVFKEAKAIFENDKLSFDLDPNRMEMPGLLKVLTDASKNIPASGDDGSAEEDGDSGPFKIGLIEVDGSDINTALHGRTIPIGVKASLDIPPISVGGGTTSMTNLSFGGSFLLQFWDIQLKKFGFTTELGFYLGKKDAPFNFTAFILGGGGYINSKIVFKPEEGLTVNFVMSVHASVGFAVTLGWMNGSVLILMGFEGEYNKTPATGSSVYVTIFVQIIGVVNIMGLVTVYLGLRLEATYTGAQLIGKGTVKLKIKICWCLTISVNKEYKKQFAGSESKSNRGTPVQKATKISNTLS